MRLRNAALAAALTSSLLSPTPRAQEVASEVTERVDDLRRLDVRAIPVNDFITKIDAMGAIALINTSDGSVVIDTGFYDESSAKQKALVDEIAAKPIRKLILTHAHPDHAGGIKHWKRELERGTELVAHQRYRYMSRHQLEPKEYWRIRYSVLYPDSMDAGPDRPFWKLTPDREVFVGQDYDFTLGEVRFQVIALQNGGEGEDSLLVWLPDQKVLFTGDLFGTLYPMFPNLYTVRGEKYRDPLDYIDALDLVLSLEPEIMVPTHFHVIEGADYIRRSVTRMRDAVQFVWDETLERMNAGKTVWEAMEEIELPPELALSQGHGKVSWSVRAAWEILAGWYHYDSVANLYHVPPDAVYADLIELSGGSDALAKRARRYLDAGRPLEALRLLDIAGVAPTKRVLETRAAVLEQLVRAAREGLNNYTEVGLLEADLRGTRERLEASAAP
jgi:alkyl sulfatase BDS1-like metallo-beta-lactamase superfamily hydrolase